MHKAKSLLTLFIFLLLSVTYTATVAASYNYMAQSQDMGAGNQEVSDIQTQELSGTVLRKDSNRITVQTDQGVKELTVPENVTVMRNTFESDLASIETNDRVNMMVSEDGEVLSLEATSGEVFDWGRWLLPAALIVLLIAGMIYIFWRKSNQGHIKTEVPGV